ncbi:velvet factor-domain-containing protein [Whalleya microplaca]|nr:velvet factor-domain-containing protein [Whalleya microplaca]
MARPPDSWAHEPYAPRHSPYYPQEHHQSHILRLPPPSSLVSGSHPNQDLPNGRDPAAYRHNPYRDPYAASPPVHHNPQPPVSLTEIHPAAISTHARRPAEMPARLSPAHSSTASDRSEDLSDHYRQRHLVGEPSSFQQGTRLPVRHSSPGEPARQNRYAEIHPLRHPSSHQAHDPRIELSPQIAPSSRPGWSPQSEPRAPERMRISQLLSDEPRSETKASAKAPGPRRAPAAPPSTYRIRVRQQPVAARSCGFGERDRRVIDPPPIVQVSIVDPNASPDEVRARLKFQYAVMHCTIWNETGDQDCSAMPDDYRQQRRLMGTLVASPFVGMDENNEEGCFFCFPDLSCRTPGTFRLRFCLVVLDPLSQPGSRTPVCAIAMSEVFTVYNAKDFPGMRASTTLTKRLKEQGCLISIKKGNERTHARDESEEDDEDDEDNGGGSSGRRSKRARRS